MQQTCNTSPSACFGASARSCQSDFIGGLLASQDGAPDVGAAVEVAGVGDGTLEGVEELAVVDVTGRGDVEAGTGVEVAAVEVARVEVAAEVLGAMTSLWLGVVEAVTSAGTSLT